MDDAYVRELVARTRQVLAGDPHARDYLRAFPWMKGALGDPRAEVWFVGESPSRNRAERAEDPGGGPPSAEAQWWASRGDRLFRELLYKHGFKSTPPEEPGGWGCYLTNVVKEPGYGKRWRSVTRRRRNEAAERWAPVLAWELSEGRPALVVALGKRVDRMLDHLNGSWVHLPRVETIAHYAYVAHRPEGRLGRMHPDRVARFDDELGRVADHARLLRLAPYGFGHHP